MKRKQEIKTEKELLEVLEKIPYVDDEQRNSIACSLIGHSLIQETCFGYYSCGRCGAQLGDSLGSIYLMAPDVVVIGHNCPTCKANYKRLSWKDKVFVKNPLYKNKAIKSFKFGKKEVGK